MFASCRAPYQACAVERGVRDFGHPLQLFLGQRQVMEPMLRQHALGSD